MPRGFDRRPLPLDRSPLKQLADDVGRRKSTKDFTDAAARRNANGVVDTIRLQRRFRLGDLFGEWFGGTGEPDVNPVGGLSAGVSSGRVDLGTRLLEQRYKAQAAINNTVREWFGWIDDIDWTPDDSARALADQASTVANLSAAVTALENDKNNQSVGGRSVFVDFTGRAPASSLGPDFDQIYTLGGDGLLGIGNGGEWHVEGSAGPRLCSFRYNLETTATDYQRIGIAFGSVPQPGLGVAARNEIHGRKNVAGTRYVFGAMEKYQAQLCCMVDGVPTVWRTTPSNTFSFKSNAIYWLECGTVGSLRVYRLLEGNTPVLVHTEVGTTSFAGPDYRGAGGAVYAYANGFSTLRPGRMSAFALSDNQPSTVIGSGAIITRTDTGVVSVSAGSAVLPNGFWNTPQENSPDLSVDYTLGRITASVKGWYVVTAHVRLAGQIPNNFALFVHRGTGSGGPSTQNALLARAGHYSGARVTGGGDTYYNPAYPDSIGGSALVFLDEGQYVEIGYNSPAAVTGLLTGAAGMESLFAVSLANRSLA